MTRPGRIELVRVKTRRTAVKRAPWAAVLVKVPDGYMAFEHERDLVRWLQTGRE